MLLIRIAILLLVISLASAQDIDCTETKGLLRDLDGENLGRARRATALLLQSGSELWHCLEESHNDLGLAWHRFESDVAPGIDAAEIKEYAAALLQRTDVSRSDPVAKKWVARVLKIAAARQTVLLDFGKLWEIYERCEPASDWAPALAILLAIHDRQRLLERLLEGLASEEPAQVRRSIRCLMQFEVTPDRDLLLRVMANPDETVASESRSLIAHAGREQLPLLLELVSMAREGEPVHALSVQAEHSLAQAAFMSYQERQQRFTIGVLADRAEWWRRFWADHIDDSENQLQDRSAAWLAKALVGSESSVERAQIGITPDLATRPTLFELLLQRTKSADPLVADQAARTLLWVVIEAEENFATRAQPAVLAWLRAQPRHSLMRLFDGLRFGSFPRLFDLLAELLEEPSDDAEGWHRHILECLARSGRPEARAILHRELYERKNAWAGTYLPLLPDTDGLFEEAFAAFMGTDDPAERRQALAALNSLATPDISARLHAALEEMRDGGVDVDAEHLRQIHWLMSENPAESQRAYYEELIHSTRAAIVAPGASALVKLGDWRGAHRVLDLLPQLDELRFRGDEYHFRGGSVATFLRTHEAPDKPGLIRTWFEGRDQLDRLRIVHLIAEDPHTEPVYWDLLGEIAPALASSAPVLLARAAQQAIAVSERTGRRLHGIFHQDGESTAASVTESRPLVEIPTADSPPPIRALIQWCGGGKPPRPADEKHLGSPRLQGPRMNLGWSERDACLIAILGNGDFWMTYVFWKLDGEWRPIAMAHGLSDVFGDFE